MTPEAKNWEAYEQEIHFLQGQLGSVNDELVEKLTEIERLKKRLVFAGEVLKLRLVALGAESGISYKELMFNMDEVFNVLETGSVE